MTVQVANSIPDNFPVNIQHMVANLVRKNLDQYTAPLMKIGLPEGRKAQVQITITTIEGDFIDVPIEYIQNVNEEEPESLNEGIEINGEISPADLMDVSGVDYSPEDENEELEESRDKPEQIY